MINLRINYIPSTRIRQILLIKLHKYQVSHFTFESVSMLSVLNKLYYTRNFIIYRFLAAGKDL